MQTQKFVETLIKTLFLSEGDFQTDFIMDQLQTLTQKTEISSIIYSLFTKSTDKSKERILYLYLKYILQNETILDIESQDELFNLLKIIITLQYSSLTFLRCNLIIQSMKSIISKLTKYNLSSISSAVYSWDSLIKPLAMVSISLVYDQFTGNSLSYLIENKNLLNTETQISAFYMFFKNFKYQTLDSQIQTLYDNKQVTKSLGFFIEFNIDKFTVPTLQLVNSMFSFLDPPESATLCYNLRESLQKQLKKDDISIRLSAASVISCLKPCDNHEFFNTVDQLVYFFPLFILSPKDIDNQMCDYAFEFIKPRISHSEFKKLFYDPFMCAIVISSKFDVYSLEDLSSLFPEEIRLDIAVNLTYLATHHSNWLTKSDDLIKKVTKALLFSLHSYEKSLGEALAGAFFKFTEECQNHLISFLESLLENIYLFNSSFTRKTVSHSLNLLLELNHNLIPPSVDKSFLVNAYVTYMLTYVNEKTQGREEILLILLLLKSSFLSEKIDQNILNESVSSPFAKIFDLLIPEGIADDVHKALLDIDSYEANILCISLNSNVVNPEKIAQNAESIEPFNLERFLLFYENCGYRNPTLSIDRLIKLLNQKQNSLLKRFLFNQQLVIPKTSIFEGFSKIIKFSPEIKPTHAQAMLTIFDSNYSLSKESLEFLFVLLEKCNNQRMNISSNLQNIILSEPFFGKCLPNFITVIERSDENLNKSLKTFLSAMKSDKNILSSSATFLKNCFLTEQKADFDSFVDIVIDNGLSDINILNFMSRLCEYSPDNFKNMPKLLSLLIQLFLSENEEERKFSLISAQNIFRIDSNIAENRSIDTFFVSEIGIFLTQIISKISKETIPLILNELMSKEVTFMSLLFIKNMIDITGIEFVTKATFEFILKLTDKSDKNVLYMSKEILQKIYNTKKEFCIENIFNLKNNLVTKEFVSNNIDDAFLMIYLKLLKKYSIDTAKSIDNCSFQFAFCQTSNVKILWSVYYLSILALNSEECLASSDYGFVVNQTISLISKTFSSFGVDTKKLSLSYFKSQIEMSSIFTEFLRKIPKSHFENLVDPSSEIFSFERRDNNDIVVSTVFLISDLYLIYKDERYEDTIAKICLSMKDDSCRDTVPFFYKVFENDILSKFKKSTISGIFHAVRRTLINPDNSPQRIAYVLMFCRVMHFVSHEDISKNKEKIFEIISQSLEISHLIQISHLLDAVSAYVEVDSDINSFLNMNQLSLPRLLILSINDDEVVREKSKTIIKKLAKIDADDNLISGIASIIGIEQTDVIGRAFLNWVEKNSINHRVMYMIYCFVECLLPNKRSKFIEKVYSVLLSIVDKNDTNQRDAIQLMSTIISKK